MAKPRSTKVYNLQQLAAATHRAKSTVHLWTTRTDWPFGHPRNWLVKGLATKDVQVWMASTLQRGKSDEEKEDLRSEVAKLGPLQRAKLQKTMQETAKLKRTNELLDDLYIDKSKARREVAAVIQNVKTQLLAEATSAAQNADSRGLLAAGKKNDVAKLLRNRFEAICMRFAQAMRETVDRKP